jgi:hypothetical protein
MKTRDSLQEVLEEILGSEFVYFQPPTNIKMSYPCIVYSRSTGRTRFADNSPWRYTTRYRIQLISKNPDNEAFDKLKDLEMCSYDRHYTADNLHHDCFNIYW